MADTIEVEAIRRLDVHPGEVLLVELTQYDQQTYADMDRIQKVLRENLPEGVEVLIVGGDIRISVIAKQDEGQHV